MKGKDKDIPDILRFRKMLRDKGLKATPQRLAVHEAMRMLVHAGADEVAAQVAAQGGTPVSPASVYNILSTLADLGIYDRRCVRADRHLHLYDTQNQNWRDLNDAELVSWFEAHFKGRRFRGYKIDGFEVLLLCHPTRKTARAK